MKVAPFKRFLQDDYHSAPQWFFDFLGNLNQMIDSLNPALQSGLDIENNLTAEVQQVTVSHEVPITLKMRRIVTPRLVRLGYASGYHGVAGIVGFGTDGSVQVIVSFVGQMPPGPVAVELVFEPLLTPWRTPA